MKKFTAALVLPLFLLVGCGSGNDGPNGEDVWYEVQEGYSDEIPAECLDIEVTVYEGGDLDQSEDQITTHRYCLEDSE